MLRHMFWTPKRKKAAKVALAVTVGLCITALVLSHTTSSGAAIGQVGARLSDGTLLVAKADHPMAYRDGSWSFTWEGQEGRVRQDGDSWWSLGRTRPKLMIGTVSPVIVSVVVRSIPLWSLTLTVLVLAAPAWWLLSRSHGPSACTVCGYDTTGLKTVCPECGTAVAVHVNAVH